MKMVGKHLAVGILCVMLLCASCARYHKLTTEELTINKANGTTVMVKAEMAHTHDERQAGFMYRNSIPEGTGMLFLFERDQHLSFWMKNTPCPLSIAYIDSNGIIRDIFDMTPYSLSDTSSTFSARYALEVPQGWFDRQGVAQGDRLEMNFDTRAD